MADDIPCRHCGCKEATHHITEIGDDGVDQFPDCCSNYEPEID